MRTNGIENYKKGRIKNDDKKYIKKSFISSLFMQYKW